MNNQLNGKHSKYLLLLIFLVILFLIINYSLLDNFLKSTFDFKQKVIIERVIDGDTAVVNGTSIRLLGIDTPEKNEKYFYEAKRFLENEILNKTVILEFSNEKRDKYDRILAYVYYKNKNVNLKLIERGLANPYFPSGKDKYHKSFFSAWEKCVNKNRKDSLCEKSNSNCSSCIKIDELDFKNQEVVFENSCSFDCSLSNWSVEDEGRRNFDFPKNTIILARNNISLIVSDEKKQNTEKIIFWKRENPVWTDSGDTLFLRDNKEKLVLWKNY